MSRTSNRYAALAGVGALALLVYGGCALMHKQAATKPVTAAQSASTSSKIAQQPASLASLKPKSNKKLPANAKVDRVLVEKSARTMSVYQQGVLLKQYTVSLGFTPKGHKQVEGDGKTPEGIYQLDWRNPNSIAYLSFHINYPNAKDRAHAAALGVSPGGEIMVHGLYNAWKDMNPARIKADWTNGCVAVSNADMDELWRAVPDGPTIEIRP